jgi:N-methylhydantoinase A
MMTNALRTISIERGRDVRGFTLVAFGGAGPAHAAEIARELSIPRVLVPPFPGCTSAFGAVITGSRRDFLRTVGRRSDRVELASLEQLNASLRRAADEALEREHVAAGDRVIQTWLDLRYEGQVHELSVEHSQDAVSDVSLREAIGRFHRLHEQLYGHCFGDVPVEVVTVRVKGMGRRPEVSMWWDWARTGAAAGQLDETRPIYYPGRGFVDSAVHLREELSTGDRLDGPVVIHQLDSTVVVPPGFTAEVLASGSMVLHARHDDRGTVTGTRASSQIPAEVTG